MRISVPALAVLLLTIAAGLTACAGEPATEGASEPASAVDPAGFGG